MSVLVFCFSTFEAANRFARLAMNDGFLDVEGAADGTRVAVGGVYRAHELDRLATLADRARIAAKVETPEARRFCPECGGTGLVS